MMLLQNTSIFTILIIIIIYNIIITNNNHIIYAKNEDSSSSSSSNHQYKTTQKHDKLYRGLYLGWLGKYNEGDEAMYHVASELFANVGINMGISVTLFPFKPPLTCHLFHLTLTSYDFIIHGGGSILGSPEYQCLLKQSTELGIPTIVFGTGWEASDSTGGKRLLQYFQQQNVGFNIEMNEDVANRHIIAIKSYQYGGFRGIYTKTIADLLYPNHGLDIIGDSGILSKRLMNSYSNTLNNGINIKEEHEEEQQRRRRRNTKWNITPLTNDLPIIAINYGQNHPDDPAIFHSSTETLFTSFVDLGASLVKYGYNVIYYSMSADDLQFVGNLYTKTFDVLNAINMQDDVDLDFNIKDRVHILKYVPDTINILELLSDSYFSINYKLHGNVLSASVGTPFICVAYHLKSMEFARFIDVSIETKYSIRSDFIDSANSFEAALEALHTDGEMERYTQLLNEKISVTNLKYNEMIMNVLKDVVLRRLDK